MTNKYTYEKKHQLKTRYTTNKRLNNDLYKRSAKETMHKINVLRRIKERQQREIIKYKNK